jgi:hypothetical protein
MCSFLGCVEFIAGYVIGGATAGGAIGGAIGCTIAGGIFDPPGCAAAWAGGAAIGGTLGAFVGLGYGGTYVALEEIYGP